MATKHKFLKIFVFAGIVIPLIAVVLGYYFVLPKHIDLDKYKTQIRSAFEESIAYPAELGNLDIQLTWNLRARLGTDRIVIKRPDSAKFLEIGPSSLEVSLLALLKNNIVLKRIDISTLNADITRLENGKLNIEGLLARNENPKYKVSLKKTEIYVGKYNIDFTEKYIKPAKKYLFLGNKIEIRKFTPEKFIEIASVGKVTYKDKPSYFDITLSTKLPVENTCIKGEIVDVEPNDLIPYLNKILPVKLVSIADKASLKFDIELCEKAFNKNKFYLNGIAKNLKLKTLEHGVFSEHEETLKFLSRGFYNKNIITIDTAKIDGNGIRIRTSGKIKNYRAEKDKIQTNLKLVLDKTGTQPLAKLFPKIIKVKRSPFKNILKHKVKALISGKVDIEKKSDKPKVFGFVRYEDFEMLGGFKDTPKAYGEIRFSGAELFMKNRLFLAKDKYVDIIGSVNPFTSKDMNINVISTEIDLARVQKVLFALKDFFRMRLGEVLNMKFYGNGRSDLNFSGKTYNILVNGNIEALGLTVWHNRISKPLTNVRGKVKFSGKKIYYDETTGFMEGMKVYPTGYSTLRDPKTGVSYCDAVIHIPRFELEKGIEVIRTSPLMEKAKDALSEILRVTGYADARIHIEGTKEDPKHSGQLVFKDSGVLYKGFGGWFKNIKGNMSFKDEDIYFEGLTTKVKDNNLKVSGFIKGNYDSKLNISSDSVNLKSIKEFLMGSYILTEAREVLPNYTELDGTSNVNLLLEGNLNNNPFYNLTLKDSKAVFKHKLVGMPIELKEGSLEVSPDKINVKNLSASLSGVDASINGSLENIKACMEKKEKLSPDFTLAIEKFDLSKTGDLSQVQLLPEKIRNLLANFDELHGYAKVYVDLKPKNYNIKIIPDKISGVYKPYDAFMIIQSGEAEISDKNVKLTTVKGVLSKSTFNIAGYVNDYAGKPEFDVNANININFNDVKKFRIHSDIPVYAGGLIPISVTVNGDVKDWKLTGRMVLEKGSYLNYITDIGLPKDQVRLVTLDAIGSHDKLNVQNLRVDMSNRADTGGFYNLVQVHGVIDKIKSKKPIFKDFIVQTNNETPISPKLFNPSIGCLLNNGCNNFFADGDFKTDIKLNGPVDNPVIDGVTAFRDVTIPDYNAAIRLITFNFDKKGINLDIQGFRIGSSLLNAQVLVDAKQKEPLLIKNIQINSSNLNIDEITKILSKDQVEITGAGLPPFVISNGILNADKLIMGSLINTNVNALFNLTPDWLLTVSKLKFATAGGTGTGNIYYNIGTSDLSANFDVENMQANALAATMISLPNEVYGTLNGNFQFSTRGKNRQELIANSNGYAEFEAYKGHFVRLGSLEYFLRAVNVVHSGIGGFNLNNVIDLITPQKTGHFERLRGKVRVKNGVLYTDDITSSGKNLSLYMAGELDLLTNRSDILVLGRLSKKVSGMLGPVGSLSINEFIDYIPGLGFLPTTPNRKGVIDLIPGLSKIPGLELSNEEKYRRFAVQIKGDLYKQESVKSFRWIE